MTLLSYHITFQNNITLIVIGIYDNNNDNNFRCRFFSFFNFFYPDKMLFILLLNLSVATNYTSFLHRKILNFLKHLLSTV